MGAEAVFLVSGEVLDSPLHLHPSRPLLLRFLQSLISCLVVFVENHKIDCLTGPNAAEHISGVVIWDLLLKLGVYHRGREGWLLHRRFKEGRLVFMAYDFGVSDIFLILMEMSSYYQKNLFLFYMIIFYKKRCRNNFF